MSKKILVTGVAGFIGSHLVKQLRALGYAVAGCDKVDPSTG
ncbi:MAG: NAD(P)-dependent oxidoreductase, partial [Betaproteobacteria bacterium]|nr:NAD(P)-dependent oxidoreductase [Betaproteobacteria bacterium]